jgi:hypothetical protein
LGVKCLKIKFNEQLTLETTNPQPETATNQCYKLILNFSTTFSFHSDEFATDKFFLIVSFNIVILGLPEKVLIILKINKIGLAYFGKNPYILPSFA